ncbi:IQ motif, EF-hand binding site containing protein [Tanacetum coccineum]
MNYEGTYYGGVAPAPFSRERPNGTSIAALPHRLPRHHLRYLLWKTTKICKPYDALSSDQTSEFEANDVEPTQYLPSSGSSLHIQGIWSLYSEREYQESEIDHLGKPIVVDAGKAMDIVGINSAEQDAIFRVVVASIHLGNIDFTKGSESDFSQVKDDKSPSHLESAADPFMCDKTVLEYSFCTYLWIEEAVINKEMTEIQANCILNQPFALAQEKHSGSALDQCHQCKTLCTLKDVRLIYATRLCIPDAIVVTHQLVVNYKSGGALLWRRGVLLMLTNKGWVDGNGLNPGGGFGKPRGGQETRGGGDRLEGPVGQLSMV